MALALNYKEQKCLTMKLSQGTFILKDELFVKYLQEIRCLYNSEALS